MTNQEIREIIGEVPHMSLEEADRMRAFVNEHRPRSILELGFRHGVSTCYFAHALKDVGGERIVTIDREAARAAEPNIEALLERVGGRELVEVHYEPTSYNWHMMKMLEEDPSPRFDLCYVDGAHDWFTDGFAFFLVDKLLNPGGWIIFDDLDWTFTRSPSLRDSERVKNMPDEEKKTPQVRRVYELLVKPHPSYDSFRVDGGWGYARKRHESDEVLPFKTEVVVEERPIGLGALAMRAFRKARRLVR